MAAESKVPVRQEKLAPSSTLQASQPFEGLRQEIDRCSMILVGGSRSGDRFSPESQCSGAP